MTTSSAAAAVEGQQARQDHLEELYDQDGRHEPSHPMHGLYTGLVQHTPTPQEEFMVVDHAPSHRTRWYPGGAGMNRSILCTIARLIAPWRTIRRLEATVQRLEHVLSNPMLAGIEIGRETAITAGMRGSGPELLAGMFLGLMQEQGKNAPNYLELSFVTPKGKILVTVTQPNGATPHQLRTQAEQRVKELEAELAELRAGMEAP